MSHEKTEITVVGDDDVDIVVEMTSFLFERNVDIAGLDQAAHEGTVRTTAHVDTSEMTITRKTLREDVADLGDELGVDVQVRFPSDREMQSIAVLVTKESHCLEALLEAGDDGDLGADIEVVIGNHDDLQQLAAKYDVPFHDIADESGTPDEERLLDLLNDYDIDLIALARYIRILSPEVVFRYESRIINVHPSLLPAFPGASPYSQAVEEGVRIAGVTAHYVTTDLDQGPIITQRAFNVPDGATKADLQERGQPLEAEALTEAVKLRIDGKIAVCHGQTELRNPKETDAQLGAPEELDRRTPDRPIDIDEFVVGDRDETVSADD